MGEIEYTLMEERVVHDGGDRKYVIRGGRVDVDGGGRGVLTSFCLSFISDSRLLELFQEYGEVTNWNRSHDRHGRTNGATQVIT